MGFLLLVILLALIARAGNEEAFDENEYDETTISAFAEISTEDEFVEEVIMEASDIEPIDTVKTLNDTAVHFHESKPFDVPTIPTTLQSQILIRKGYTVSYNKETKQPNWVAWHLTSAHTDGEWARPSGNAFHEDMEAPSPRASNYDFRGSGWSRGHMCPAGDNKWDSDAMYETFLLSNICPQNERLNSGDWNDIEQDCRRWAKKYGDIYIVCGPIFYQQEHETIGTNKIPVPEAFFKVVLRMNGKPTGIGFICKNTEGNRKTDFYVNTIAQVERITGFLFFPDLPIELNSQVKENAHLQDW